MQRSSLIVAWACLSLAACSILYFFSLPLQVPVWLTAVLWLAGCLVLYRGLFSKRCVLQEEEGGSRTLLQAALLLGGMIILVNKTYYLLSPHGGWDAWAFWNLHAKYLADPQHWTDPYYKFEHLKAFTTPVPHPDYPLLLPATNGFFWRLLGHAYPIVPFAVSVVPLIAIPAIIFLETARKNLFLAALVLLYLVTDETLINVATAQYADAYVALFLLLAFVCLGNHKEHGRPWALVLTGAFLGCCLWTKNEGLLLVSVFLLVYSPYLLKEKRWLYVLGGMALPVLALVVFKTMYAPPNDLVEGKGAMKAKLADKSRYRLIWEVFKTMLDKYFPYLRYILALYLLRCAVLRRAPATGLLVILGGALGFTFVYLTTPHDLEWHLHTSMDRLIFQLAPSFLFLVCADLIKQSGPERFRNLPGPEGSSVYS